MKRLLLLAVLALALMPASASAAAQGAFIGACDSTSDPEIDCATIMSQLDSLGFQLALVNPARLDAAEQQLLGVVADQKGMGLVWSVPYTQNRFDARAILNNTKQLSTTWGYYIADEPCQFAADPAACKPGARTSIGQWATEIKQTAPAGRNRTYTAHYGCDTVTIDNFQGYFATLANLDFAMVDCYPWYTSNWLNLTRTQTREGASNSIAAHHAVGHIMQAFDWRQLPEGAPPGLYGYPSNTAVQKFRDCSGTYGAHETWWFGAHVWRDDESPYYPGAWPLVFAYVFPSASTGC